MSGRWSQRRLGLNFSDWCIVLLEDVEIYVALLLLRHDSGVLGGLLDWSGVVRGLSFSALGAVAFSCSVILDTKRGRVR